MKDKYEKSGDGIKIKNDENETIYYAASIKLTCGDKLKECIKDAGWKQILSDEESRLLNSWNDELFDLLLSKLEEVDEGQAAPEDSEAPTGSTKEIPEGKWKMTDTDFNDMKTDLWKDMFIIENPTENWAKTYYKLDKVKAYLQKWTLEDNKNDFGLHTTKNNMVKRREWISAVQILLNDSHLGDNEKIQVDWKFGTRQGIYSGETYNAVKKFQTEYNEAHQDANPKLDEDWVPGPNTLKALLEPATTT